MRGGDFGKAQESLMDRDFKTLLPPVTDLVLSAGREIMNVYVSDEFEARRKEDDLPLTEADCRSHEILISRLAALTPEIPVVSEEDKERIVAEQPGGEPFWLVDPLDGTKEFLKRSGEFTVNVGLNTKERQPLCAL
jgi:3'(2'), 5'-bisphosphate nucleotidase